MRIFHEIHNNRIVGDAHCLNAVFHIGSVPKALPTLGWTNLMIYAAFECSAKYSVPFGVLGKIKHEIWKNNAHNVKRVHETFEFGLIWFVFINMF